MNRLINLVAVAIALYAGFHGYKVNQAYTEKARQQEVVNTRVADTGLMWDSLAPVRDKWNAMFEPLSGIGDLYSINNALNLDRTTFMYEMTSVIDAGRESISYRGTNIGLVKACIKNESNGMHVQSRNISSMLADISHLEERNSITFNSITVIDGGDGRKHLLFDSLCVLLRGEDAF